MAPLLARLGLGRSGFGFGKKSGGPSGPAGITATGGTITTPGNGYRYHAFTSPGPATFTVTALGAYGDTVEYLVVGGGGAGGADRTGGGGGAGGLRTATGFPVSASPGSYAITVGAGAVLGGNGSPSIFSTITSQGGGRGGTDPDYFGPTGGTGFPGGSGGGARSNTTASGGSGSSVTGTNTPAPSQGNPGGSNVGGAGALGGSGGGGAGAAGGPVGPGASATAGGVGLQYPQFTGPLIGVPALAPLSGYFAGGGGGGNSEPAGGTFAPGGLGGGGRGQSGDSGTSPLPGTANSGGGGGGAGPSSGGGTGGSGIVIIRYLV
jgi:hypothetical protein